MRSYTRAFVAFGLGILIAMALLHLPALSAGSRASLAFVHLTLFGWPAAIIFAINYHTVPYFAGADFPSERSIWLHFWLFVVGLLVVVAGLARLGQQWLVIGLAIEFAASVVFLANIVWLFARGPKRAEGPPEASASQHDLDRAGTLATIFSGLLLPLSLLLLLLYETHTIGPLWQLAAEHLATLGWIVMMIVGVSYHILPRFSGREAHSGRWPLGQLALYSAGTALLVLGLGLAHAVMFQAGAVLVTTALVLLAWIVWPTLKVRRDSESEPAAATTGSAGR
jgi:hypothetical protein